MDTRGRRTLIRRAQRLGQVLLATFTAVLAASQPLQCGEAGALVQTAKVREGQLAQKLVVFGVIAADPDAELSITTPRPGLIAAEYVRAGEPVTKGAALFELDTSPVSAAQARQAEAAVAYERTRLDRLRPLEPKGLVTAETIAATEKALADAEAQLAQVRALGGNIPKQVVRSPASGIVTKVLASVGDRIQADAIVMKVADEKSMIAALGIEPTDVDSIALGAAVEMEAIARPSLKLAAKIDRLNAMVNPTTGLVDAVAKLSTATSQRLIIGMTVKATVSFSPFKGLIVDRAAVLRDQAGTFVFVVKDGKATRKTVDVLFEQDGISALTGDLSADAHVIVKGGAGLRDGAIVREALTQ